MNYYVVEDSELAKKNKSLVGSCGVGAGVILYNAVLSVSFSDDGTETEPVTLQEAKDWCRIDIDDDDALITLLITAARIICENHANLSFIERTVTAKIINGLGGFILPYGPVTSLTSVTLADATNIYDANFSIDDAYGQFYTVVYDAGYATLPQNLRHAILNQIAFMYETRGSEMSNTGVSELSKLILNQVRSV